MKVKALVRDEVIKIIEGKGCADRIPMLIDFWVHQDEFGIRKNEVVKILASYPNDAQCFIIKKPQIFDAPSDDPNYKWMNIDTPYLNTSVGIDEQIGITDWCQLEDILKSWPDPNYPNMFTNVLESDGRYRLGVWWNFFFEVHWKLRGMTNALMDPHTNPYEVHRIFKALTDFYLVVIERASKEAKLDGFFVSDDLGTQNGPFFSLETFRTFFKPYYRELIDKAHSLGIC